MFEQVAIMDHEPRSGEEVRLRRGDAVWVAGNHWNGVSKGTNSETGQVGLYPVYKTREKIKVAGFPIYPHVKVRRSNTR